MTPQEACTQNWPLPPQSTGVRRLSPTSGVGREELQIDAAEPVSPPKWGFLPSAGGSVSAEGTELVPSQRSLYLCSGNAGFSTSQVTVLPHR